MTNEINRQQRVVIVGGGFGGLYAAKALSSAAVQVTLVDRRNFHLFQPLLYQVATGGLSPGDISAPLRSVLKKASNVEVVHGEVVDIRPERRQVILHDATLEYDKLIVATGVSHHYFGHDDWEDAAPGLKTVEDALEIRRRILLAFETAERVADPAERQAWLTFVIVGGGPTGVELAGAIGELAHRTMRGEFRHVDPSQAQIILLEGLERILTAYPPELSAEAAVSLADLGVTVRTGALVTGVGDSWVTVRDSGGSEERLPARTVLWAAGVKASPMAQVLARRAGAELDRLGRVFVEADLSLAGWPEIYVIGDLAHYAHQTGEPLPGVAQVAMQQGAYVAERLAGRQRGPFVYQDKGNLAVIGRNAAVADLGRLRLSGFPAWLIWVFVHIRFLIEFDNKLMVMVQWAWNYLTRKRGARLITGPEPYPNLGARAGVKAGDKSRRTTIIEPD